MAADKVVGLQPVDTAWWRAQDGTAPSIVLRCAECRTTQIGVVKVDSEVVYVGARTRVAETWVPNPPLAAPTKHEVRQMRADLDAVTLRYSDDGTQRLTKRMNLGIKVFRLSGGGHASGRVADCAVHGERHVPDIQELCELAIDLATHGKKQSLLV